MRKNYAFHRRKQRPIPAIRRDADTGEQQRTRAQHDSSAHARISNLCTLSSLLFLACLTCGKRRSRDIIKLPRGAADSRRDIAITFFLLFSLSFSLSLSLSLYVSAFFLFFMRYCEAMQEKEGRAGAFISFFDSSFRATPIEYEEETA